jgi:hypothetical protein
MTLDEAVVWLNDRCGKGVAVWLTDGEHVVGSAEGELHHARDADRAQLGFESTYDVEHVRIVVEQGNVLLIDFSGENVVVYGTDRAPQPMLWPSHDPHLVVGLSGVGELHIAEQEQVARSQRS